MINAKINLCQYVIFINCIPIDISVFYSTVCLYCSVGSLLIVICGLKLLRFSFSNTPKQHMILAFTVLFFKYDFRLASETTLIDLFFFTILFTKVGI